MPNSDYIFLCSKKKEKEYLAQNLHKKQQTNNFIKKKEENVLSRTSPHPSLPPPYGTTKASPLPPAPPPSPPANSYIANPILSPTTSPPPSALSPTTICTRITYLTPLPHPHPLPHTDSLGYRTHARTNRSLSARFSRPSNIILRRVEP